MDQSAPSRSQEPGCTPEHDERAPASRAPAPRSRPASASPGARARPGARGDEGGGPVPEAEPGPMLWCPSRPMSGSPRIRGSRMLRSSSERRVMEGARRAGPCSMRGRFHGAEPHGHQPRDPHDVGTLGASAAAELRR
eukprot:8525317-Lingulodinium_polyedra.AAC.1